VIEILNPAGQKTIVLQGRHLKWLNDGQSFLAHVGDLAVIGLDAVCRHCLAAGVCDPVRALLLGDGHYMEVACRHHAGKVKVDAPLDIQPLLAALDWTLLCPDCGEEVRGDNPVTATRFTVDCACTTRVYQLAVA
jgi:hypothetical protein